MRNICLNISIIILLFGCRNDDDSANQDPLSQLPPATQTGENTFGCLLDGEPFIPKGGVNPLDCVYQLIEGKQYLTVDASKRNDSFNLISISISTNAKELEMGQTYDLIENEVGNAYGQYFYSGKSSFTSKKHTGILEITRLDLSTQIISGTFSFDVLDQNGKLLKIRNGRFDMRFTQ